MTWFGFLPPISWGTVSAAKKTVEMLAAEREAEWATVEKAWQAELDAATQKARTEWQTQFKVEKQAAIASFEADLASKSATQRAEFETYLKEQYEAGTYDAAEWASFSQKEWTKFESNLKTQEKTSRDKFFADLEAEKRTKTADFEKALLGEMREERRQFRRGVHKARVKAKKEYAELYGVQLTPQQIAAWEKGELAKFELGLTTWKKEQELAFEKALGTFEVGAIEKFGEDIVSWKETQRTEFTTNLSNYIAGTTISQEAAFKTWRTEQEKIFGVSLQTWEKGVKEEFYGTDLSKALGTGGLLETWELGEKATLTTGLEEFKETETSKLLTEYKPEWEEAWAPAGIAERLFSIETTPILDIAAGVFGLKKVSLAPRGIFELYVPTDSPLAALPSPKARPFAGLAGIVAPFEATVIGVAGLAGVKTARPMPTPVSAGVSSVFHSIFTAGRPEWSPSAVRFGELAMESPEYAAGAAIGDVLLFWAGGKVMGKIDVALGSPLARTETWLATKVTKPLVGTRLDKFLYSHKVPYISKTWKQLHPIMGTHTITPPYPQAATGLPIVSRELLQIEKSIVFEGYTALGKGAVMYFPKTPILETAAPVITGTPFTALPTITIIGAMGEKPYVSVAAPKGRPVELPKPSIQEMMTPLSFEKYKWTMGVSTQLSYQAAKLPTLADLMKSQKAATTLSNLITAPKKIVSTLPKLITTPPIGLKGAALPSVSAHIFGAAVTVAPRVLEKARVTPSLFEGIETGVVTRPELGLLKRQAPKQLTELKKRAVSSLAESIMQVPDVALGEIAEAKTAQIVMTTQISAQILAPQTKQIQITATTPILAPPTIPLLPPWLPPRRRKVKKKKRKKKKLKIGWEYYELEYPVAKAKGVAGFILGNRRQKKRKK